MLVTHLYMLKFNKSIVCSHLFLSIQLSFCCFYARTVFKKNTFYIIIIIFNVFMTYSFISFYILDTNLILNSDTALSGDFILICFFWSFLIFVFFFLNFS